MAPQKFDYDFKINLGGAGEKTLKYSELLVMLELTDEVDPVYHRPWTDGGTPQVAQLQQVIAKSLEVGIDRVSVYFNGNQIL